MQFNAMSCDFMLCMYVIMFTYIHKVGCTPKYVFELGHELIDISSVDPQILLSQPPSSMG